MRRALIATAGLLLAIVPVAAQETLLPVAPAEIDSLLELIDAVAAAEAVVLSDGAPERRALDESALEELRGLARAAELLDADDLAARARSLLVIARAADRPGDRRSGPSVPLEPLRDDDLLRGSARYRALVNIVGATGATALALSGAFYALSERDYRRWSEETDASSGETLFQAWRGYELLSIGLGGGALVTIGGGLPLLYASARAPRAYATPPGREAYTETEREAALNELYGRRAEIVTTLDRYDARGPRRELVGRIGLATGIVGAIASTAMFYVAEELYAEYLDAPYTEDAERLGRRVRTFDALAVTGAGLAAGGFGTAAGLAVLTRDRDELAQSLRDVNRRIIEVRNAPSIEIPDRGSVQTVLDSEDGSGGPPEAAR